MKVQKNTKLKKRQCFENIKMGKYGTIFFPRDYTIFQTMRGHGFMQRVRWEGFFLLRLKGSTQPTDHAARLAQVVDRLYYRAVQPKGGGGTLPRGQDPAPRRMRWVGFCGKHLLGARG